MGLNDPRTYGSGNPGATNVLRSGNKLAAMLTLAFDALKGYVPVLLVAIYGPAYGLGDHGGASSGWRRSSATCGRCSSDSRAARAWPRRPACCWPEPLAGPGDAADLGDHRGLLPLLVAGSHRVRGRSRRSTSC
jgi:hypothetical protein